MGGPQQPPYDTTVQVGFAPPVSAFSSQSVMASFPPPPFSYQHHQQQQQLLTSVSVTAFAPPPPPPPQQQQQQSSMLAAALGSPPRRPPVRELTCCYCRSSDGALLDCGVTETGVGGGGCRRYGQTVGGGGVGVCGRRFHFLCGWFAGAYVKVGATDRSFSRGERGASWEGGDAKAWPEPGERRLGYPAGMCVEMRCLEHSEEAPGRERAGEGAGAGAAEGGAAGRTTSAAQAELRGRYRFKVRVCVCACVGT